MNLSWIQLGSLFMFLAVALGAFGSHLLRGRISDYYLDVYKTGVFYHFIHALGIFVIAWLSSHSADVKVQYAGICFMMGIVLFSGSLYFLSVTEFKWLGAITPLGGLAFLAGWVLLFISKYDLHF